MKSNKTPKMMIKVNDIFDELSDENKRLNGELMFANNCLKVLNKYKLLLNKICVKLEANIDPEVRQELDRLHEEFNSVIKNKEVIEIPVAFGGQQNVKIEANNGHNIEDMNKTLKGCDFSDKSSRRSRWTQPKIYAFPVGLKSKLNSESKPKSLPEVIPKPEDEPNSLLLLQNNNFDAKTQSYVCPNPDCDKSFSGNRGLYKHFYVVHHKKRLMICNHPNCNKSFKTRQCLKIHLTSHSERRPFTCPIEGCGHSAKTQNHINSHLVVHSNIKPYKCSECQKSFKLKSTLSTHSLTHDKKKCQPLLRCTVDGCDQSFKSRFSLLKHKELEHNFVITVKKCEWPGCDYQTKRSDSYRKHRRNHTGEKPHHCQWPGCDKKFKERTNLVVHLLVHKDLKPVACVWPGCQHRCRTTGNMIKHVRVHRK